MDNETTRAVADMIIAAINHNKIALNLTNPADIGKQIGEAFWACAKEVEKPLPRQ